MTQDYISSSVPFFIEISFFSGWSEIHIKQCISIDMNSKTAKILTLDRKRCLYYSVPNTLIDYIVTNYKLLLTDKQKIVSNCNDAGDCWITFRYGSLCNKFYLSGLDFIKYPTLAPFDDYIQSYMDTDSFVKIVGHKP